MTTFKDLDLAEPISAALETQGYTSPTPIQAQAIPLVKAGKDLMGIAQTGTGKTAAFALPILDHIVRKDIAAPKRGARVLVLAPTRELASQIAVSFRDYGQAIEGLKVVAIYGGVKAQKQILRTVQGNDVIVATPGRLLDLVDQKALRLSDVEILVLDEADQMMDMGFIHALRKIVPLVPKDRQTLFFSATMSPAITTLAKQFLTNPERVSVAPANTTAERVEQRLSFVNQKEKQALLTIALADPDIDRALIFTRTKHGADRVVKKLAAAGIEALAIHGNKSQNQRQRALEAFKSGTIRFLVATDIAARGIDIEGISHVFNFEIPNVAEQYVHRIGRTARAGRSGLAISYVAEDERAYLKDIQKLLKMTIPVVALPDNFNAEVARVARLKPAPAPAGESQSQGGGKKKARPGKWARDKKTQEKKKTWEPDLREAKVALVDDDLRAEGREKTRQSEPRKPRPASGGGQKGGKRPQAGGEPGQTRFPRKPRDGQADADKPRSEKPRSGKPSAGKPASGKPYAGKARGDKPAPDKGRSGPPRGGKPRGGAPRGNRGGV